MRRFFLLFLLILVGVGAIYYFGSFAVRRKMDLQAMQIIDSARTHAAGLPPLRWMLDRVYDQIPGSEGFIVDGGELGLADSHFIAGPPECRRPIRLLANESYSNLYDEKERQSVCVAFRIGGRPTDKATDSDAPESFLPDPRAPRLQAEQIAFDRWAAFPLAPPDVLMEWYGDIAAKETRFATNLVPMNEAFAEGPWDRLMRILVLQYPERFGELWIYAGPVFKPETRKLPTGVPIPDGFFLIAFDLTQEGGLRALAFLLPADADLHHPQNHLTSIATIEAATGLTFLPELDFAARQNLGRWVSPRLW